MSIYSIIIARGGSKGIPKKNIMKINNKPLIEYTIEQCLNSIIDDVYTSSDDDEILEIASKLGSKIIKRPSEFSSDQSTSEEAWLHAISKIPNIDINNDWIFAPQVTSPLRHVNDINNALKMALTERWDSIFSGVKFEDFFLWQKNNDSLESYNYDFQDRKRRQDIQKITYLENGSFYIFKPHGLKRFSNRLYGRIGVFVMDKIKMFQIDTIEDIDIIENMLRKV